MFGFPLTMSMKFDCGYGKKEPYLQLVDAISPTMLLRHPALLFFVTAMRAFYRKGLPNESGWYKIDIYSFRKYELSKYEKK